MSIGRDTQHTYIHKIFIKNDDKKHHSISQHLVSLQKWHHVPVFNKLKIPYIYDC